MGKDLKAALLGLGSFVPAKKLTNADFEKMLDTSDEWITSRTGIKSRHIATLEETTSDLCVPAAKAALADAGIPASEIDLVIVCTLTPDYMMPSTACVLQNKLDLSGRGVPAFDLNAACSGFLYGLSTAKAHVESGQARNVLVCGVEILSRVLDYKDRSTSILFGDGAGAAVIGRQRADGSGHAIREVNLWADGTDFQHIIIRAGGTVHPTTEKTVQENMHCVQVAGREVFRFAVTKMVEMIQSMMERHKLDASAIGKIIPHQANYRILESACERLNLPMDLFVTNLAEYGNTSAASVPLALDEAYRGGQIPKGKPVLLAAFGAGLTWASAVIDW
ncbi:MAG: ketoacyl-ACP synthase III [Planctomycetota bacterium]|nr:ketoacyl-ACP synthase III [Planctomycetota bacterium]